MCHKFENRAIGSHKKREKKKQRQKKKKKISQSIF